MSRGRSRWRIAHLSLLVAAVGLLAIGVRQLRLLPDPSLVLAPLLASATVIVLTWGLVRLLYGPRSRRAFWVGFVLAGAVMQLSPGLRLSGGNPLESRLLPAELGVGGVNAFVRLAWQRGLIPVVETARVAGLGLDAERSRSVCLSLLTLALCPLAGWYLAFCVRRLAAS